MDISRRAFTEGALSTAFGSLLTGPALAQPNSSVAGALGAIQRYGEAHLALHQLPGMTLGVITPAGERRVLNFGYANRDARTLITPDTLFQIGSISKVMVAALIHQFAAEGRVRLSDRISGVLPTVPLPAGNLIEVQHLLDHVAGLPGDAPMFPEKGLWTSYAPGQHWHYSNTGYEILGKLAVHLGGKPLASLIQERIFTQLKMSRSRGAIVAADRVRYAQGYEPADQVAVYARGVPLAPAPWVDVTAGAGCIASTADDMLSFLRALAAAAQGRGALGLGDEHARAFTSHSVKTEISAMSYGNGLMHVAEGGRTYLHHTGGMLSFSSSFHLDTASGVGAFASSTLNAFAEYRPRLLTRFAVDALTDALAGRPPASPPPLDPPLANAAAYFGRYSGPSGSFEIHPGAPLTIIAQGESATLTLWAEEVFRTAHPRFRDYSIMFERSGGSAIRAAFGSNSFVRDGSGAALPVSNPDLARLAGRYINDNPWYGASPVIERGGKLWVGTEMPMTKIADNLWRVGRESWSPERASFANFIDGRPQTFIFSGEKFLRHEV